MKRQRIYLDTSVFGGYYDEEFSIHTISLFKQIGERRFQVLLSSITLMELEKEPIDVQSLVDILPPQNVELFEVSDAALRLANKYIQEKVIGDKNLNDCLHISLATIKKADFLISWNFKHVVNVNRIRGYNVVNLREGYDTLDIRSPREFEDYEA